MIKKNFKACSHTHTIIKMWAHKLMRSGLANIDINSHAQARNTHTHAAHTALPWVSLSLRAYRCLAELAVKRQIPYIVETTATFTQQLVMLRLNKKEHLLNFCKAANNIRPCCEILSGFAKNWLFDKHCWKKCQMLQCISYRRAKWTPLEEKLLWLPPL